MDLGGQESNRQDPVAVLMAAKKDVVRRSAGYQAMFDEIAKTLGLLSNHRLLQNDAQFLSLVDGLIGVEDAEIWHDRVLALVSYANRVAKAHGVAVQATNTGPPSASILNQRPTDLADPDDTLFQRTRLQVR
ncbi:MAG: hypothetical protein AAF754_19320 [Pseudomonadota bacterium]